MLCTYYPKETLVKKFKIFKSTSHIITMITHHHIGPSTICYDIDNEKVLWTLLCVKINIDMS